MKYKIQWEVQRTEIHEAVIDETQLAMLGYTANFRDLGLAEEERGRILRALEFVPERVRESRQVFLWRKVEE